MRFSIALGVTLLGLLILPCTAAQSASAALEIAPEEQSVVLDRTGQGTGRLHANLTVMGFVCTTEATLWFPVDLTTSTGHWAGGRINGSSIRFQIPPGEPGPSESRFTADDLELVFAWNMSVAPGNSFVDYKVEIGGLVIEGGPCVPSVVASTADGPEVRVCLPASIGGPAGKYCTPGPPPTQSFDGRARTPGPTFATMLAILAVFLRFGRTKD